MEYSITRADNQLEGGRWKFSTSAYPDHHLNVNYTPEQALSYFRMHHEPNGEEIGIEEYERLHAEYEAEAKSRRPNAQAYMLIETDTQQHNAIRQKLLCAGDQQL